MWQKAKLRHEPRECQFTWPEGIEFWVEDGPPQELLVVDPTGRREVCLAYVSNIVVPPDHIDPDVRDMPQVVLVQAVELMSEFKENVSMLSEEEFLKEWYEKN